MVCKSSETRFVMLCETLLENYYSSTLNVFGSRKHDMECIRLLCYILRGDLRGHFLEFSEPAQKIFGGGPENFPGLLRKLFSSLGVENE